MTILLNGETKTIVENVTVLTILEDHKLDPQRVVVEMNEKILDKKDFATIILSEGDSLEVIQFVPGG